MSKDQLYDALTSIGGLEVINDTSTETQLRVTGRVSKARVGAWLAVLKHLIAVADNTEAFSLDASKQYFIRGGQLRYGWRLIIQSKQLASAVNQLTLAVRRAAVEINGPVVFDEDTPIPLNASPSRHAGRAGPIGSVAVGPKAKGA